MKSFKSLIPISWIENKSDNQQIMNRITNYTEFSLYLSS